MEHAECGKHLRRMLKVMSAEHVTVSGQSAWDWRTSLSQTASPHDGALNISHRHTTISPPTKRSQKPQPCSPSVSLAPRSPHSAARSSSADSSPTLEPRKTPSTRSARLSRTTPQRPVVCVAVIELFEKPLLTLCSLRSLAQALHLVCPPVPRETCPSTLIPHKLETNSHHQQRRYPLSHPCQRERMAPVE
jgi:hypothetical protein